MWRDGIHLDWDFTPMDVLGRWPAERRMAMLYSGRPHPKWARRSILAEPTGTYRFVAAVGAAPVGTGRPVGRSEWIGPPGSCPIAGFSHRPFDDLRAILDSTDGLWIGYLGYDLRRWIERLPEPSGKDDRDWPVIELGWCPGYLVHNRMTDRWSAHGTYATNGPPELSPVGTGVSAFTFGAPRSASTQGPYESMVRRCLDYIAAGDVYQVNVAQRFTADLRADDPSASRAIFAELAELSPPWYGAYLELATQPGGTGSSPCSAPGTRAIASISPELFVQVDGRDVVTRPIKGTRPASIDPTELQHSAKDEAELNMIVDLMRNDLGRVCEYGSIRVAEPRAIESHPTVHHGVGTITGRLHESAGMVDLLRATMPGGSVTGAPKVRAMQIIDELETVGRGPYCGCLGYLSRDSACLNIAIRTMLIDHAARRLDFSVGAGIVADSDPSAEYEETLDKAAAILAVLQSCAKPG